jgi:hypothetical protein
MAWKGKAGEARQSGQGTLGKRRQDRARQVRAVMAGLGSAVHGKERQGRQGNARREKQGRQCNTGRAGQGRTGPAEESWSWQGWVGRAVQGRQDGHRKTSQGGKAGRT